MTLIDHAYQLSVFDLPRLSEDGLTTERVSQLLHVSASELRQKCKTGKFWECDPYVILHKGKNNWRVLKTTL